MSTAKHIRETLSTHHHNILCAILVITARKDTTNDAVRDNAALEALKFESDLILTALARKVTGKRFVETIRKDLLTVSAKESDLSRTLANNPTNTSVGALLQLTYYSQFRAVLTDLIR